MALMQLSPSYKDYIWGGHRLVEEYNKKYEGEILAESWELSCHPDGPSFIQNGKYAGMTLKQYIDAEGKEVLGTNCRRFQDFPILIKFIDAKDNLSIQVHPDNSYALKNEGQYGKTEMWYVMDCKEGAFLYYGFQKEISREEFEKRIREDTLLEVLNAVPVHKGDVLFIEAGTIHAIGKDIVIAEIQQNSNVTYRVYDYGRVGKDGKRRELHVEKALDVTKRTPVYKGKGCNPHVASCDYFTVDKLNLDGRLMKRMEGCAGEDSFVSILFMEGSGTIRCGKEQLTFRKGDSFFMSAGSGAYEIEGSCEALVTTLGPAEASVRIGIDIGGTDTKIGLVNQKQELIAQKTVPTGADRPWQEMIRHIGEQAYALLEESGIPVTQCLGAGVGMPGTVDKRTGVVLYSNNIRWDNVPLAEELSKYLPMPVYVANDADCAALGEVAAGAAKGYQNAIMLTLGTGVGGGIVMDGKIFSGKLKGGCEVGHMIIEPDGESCTCGQKGCLEAYASATALIRDGKRMLEKTPDSLLWKKCPDGIQSVKPELIFEAAKEGDQASLELVDNYRRWLEIGIINLVNLFRPQIILVGGGVSRQGEYLLGPINRTLKDNCFGGSIGEVPQVIEAALGNKAGMIGAANLLQI